jgi:hypothetical protein
VERLTAPEKLFPRGRPPLPPVVAVSTAVTGACISLRRFFAEANADVGVKLVEPVLGERGVVERGELTAGERGELTAGERGELAAAEGTDADTATGVEAFARLA